MPNQRFTALILAAGKATRFKSSYPKVLHHLAGMPLGEYALRAALAAGPEQTYMVIGHQGEQVRTKFERPGLRFIVQKQPFGTGHALLAARRELERSSSAAVMVLVGDAPLLRSETLLELARAHLRATAAATVLTTRLDNPHGYGRVLRAPAGGSRVRAIVEESACTAAQKRIREVSSGIICFDRRPLLNHLGQLTRDNPQKEYLLTDLVPLFRRHGETVVAFPVEESAQVLGINDRLDLARAEKILRARKAENLMREGVTIVNPDTTYIDGDVRVGADSILEPGVSLLGATAVGSHCALRLGCTIADSTLGDRVTVRPYSMITGCEIASDVIIGPFAHLRDGAVLLPEARVGNFVEVKKSRIGRRTKAWHLAYLGDAVLGHDVNVGAGTVTCNYDGERKNTTTIDDRAFIGSGTMIVAPVTIGRGAYVGAGSTITDDVPPEALALGRARQVNKEGWAPSVHAERRPAFTDFQLSQRASGDVTILDLAGPLIMGAPVEEFHLKIRHLLGSGHRRVLVNMGRITYVDSTGLGSLVAALTAFRKARGEFKLAAIPARVMTILETARLNRALEICPDEPSAIAGFHSRAES